jgi:hypothetical protein
MPPIALRKSKVFCIVTGSDALGTGENKSIKCNQVNHNIEFEFRPEDAENFTRFNQLVSQLCRSQLPPASDGVRPHIPVAFPALTRGNIMIQSNAHLWSGLNAMAEQGVTSFIFVLMSPKVQGRLVTPRMCFVADPLRAIIEGRGLTADGEAIPPGDDDGRAEEDEPEPPGPTGAEFLREIHVENAARRTQAQFDADELDVRGGIGVAPGSMTINIPGLSLQSVIAVDPRNAAALLALNSTMSTIRDMLQPRMSGAWDSPRVIRRMIWEVLQRCIRSVRPGVDDGDWADELFNADSDAGDDPQRQGGDWEGGARVEPISEFDDGA